MILTILSEHLNLYLNISGKIAWARQLFRKIQSPMEYFQKYPSIFKLEDARKIVKNYNKTAKVLLEYEMLYHRAWLEQVLLTKFHLFFLM